MIAAAIGLIVVGVVLGFFFPVMFVAGAAGVVLLIVFLAGTGWRLHKGAAEEPTARGRAE